ncbi:MAG: histone deacetylase [Planctomycetota bacterium]
MSTGLIYDPRFLEHDTGPGHPERPDRLRAIVQRLEADGLWDRLARLPFDTANGARLERLHAPRYVTRVHEACAMGQPYIDTVDSAICPASDGLARLAVGGVLRAIGGVMKGEVGNAFCAVRPPGHHAEADRSMGFCLFGTVALAAEALIADHGLERVAIVDFDVHHGNGTQHLLEDRADVLFVSVHQNPQTCYPGTGYAHEIGIGKGEGFTLNVPLPPGVGDSEYGAAFDRAILPRLEEFAPQFLLLSAGFDAAAADPLAQMELSTEGFAGITERLLGVARRHAEGRVVSVLEGGYDLDALASGVAAHVGLLLDTAAG